MAFALIFVGLLLTVSAVRGTYSQLFTLVKNDFTGQGNFLYWTVIVLIIGGIGYLPPFRSLSRALLVVIVLVLLLTKGNPNGLGGGFFAQLVQGIGSAASVPPSGSGSAAANAPASAPASTLSPLPVLTSFGNS